MAVHAGLRGRNVRDGRNLDRGVTVSAIETKLADVELVAVRDGLNGTVAHVCVPRGKVVPDARDREHRTEAARDGGHDRELVPPGREDLGQWLGLRGAGGQLPRPRVRDGTVMPHPRAPKKSSQGRPRSRRLRRNLIHERGRGSSAPPVRARNRLRTWQRSRPARFRPGSCRQRAGLATRRPLAPHDRPADGPDRPSRGPLARSAVAQLRQPTSVGWVRLSPDCAARRHAHASPPRTRALLRLRLPLVRGILRALRIQSLALGLLALAAILYLQLPAARRVHPSVDPRRVLERIRLRGRDRAG